MSDETLINELKAQVESLTAQLTEASNVLAPIGDEQIKLNASKHQIEQAYREQMAAIKKQQTDLDEKKYTAQSTANSLSNQLQQIQIKIANHEAEAKKLKALQEEAAKRAERTATLGKRFDTLTMGAPWREFAKDHQISAGHKLTEDRFVILADPMGLGKTLSSIITADMVEKTTKEASDEFPFLGIEEEVFVQASYNWTQTGIDAVLKDQWPATLNDFKMHLTYAEAETPFDTRKAYWKGKPLEVGDPLNMYLAYDTRNKLVDAGIIEHIEGHYETQVTNAVKRPVGRRILYFCPSPLLTNVMEEWRTWSPHRSVTYIGNMTKAERNFALDLMHKLDEYVVIVNFEAWRRDKALLQKLIELDFDMVIIDEAHNIKDMKSTAYQGVQEVIYGLKPEYIIPMTGTPILNRPQELYSILTLLMVNEFPPTTQGLNDYLFRYCEQYMTDDSSTPKWKFKPGGLDSLVKKISKFFLRRTKDQAGIILPEKSIIHHILDRDDKKFPEQAKARKHMRDFATIVIDEKAGKALQATAMIALLTRLRQIETWPAGIVQKDPVTKEVILQLDVEESQKIDYIIRKDPSGWEGLIPDIIEDERIVVFSQFKAPLHELKARIEKAGYRAAILDGDTSSTQREEIRHDFDRKHTPDRSKAKWDVLLANYRAGGVGLNMTAATQMIILDEEWNPGKRDQAFDRIHRIGQTENITINVIRTKDTVDEWLAGIIEGKESIVNGFEGAMLTVNDLKNALDSGLI